MPSFKRIVIAGILISIIGWAGLVMVIRFALPTLGPRWLFFFFITLAISGPALPLVAFLNLRFPSIPPAEANVIIRQAGWCGIYAGVLAWLQLGRLLTSFLAIAIALGLILIETFIRIRERSRWQPKEADNA
ncbi:MAG TPA: hypothetical protein PK174_08785 [Anaerolineaceae bacterium]|nr:hypothetical protein [Anaerolineaceae bacterium]HQN05500.1 hypothetical protein [Anaerolineaceae bacterium]